MTTKSKGQVTYWALRSVGMLEIKPFSKSAHTPKELTDLAIERDEANKEVSMLGGIPVELVRVEVTPV